MTPRCPRCQSKGVPQADMYWCRRCEGLYDDDPDEGGDHSTFNPAARLEREERRQQRKMVRR